MEPSLGYEEDMWVQRDYRRFEQTARERYFNYVEKTLRKSMEQLQILDSHMMESPHPQDGELRERILNAVPDAAEMQLRREWLASMRYSP